MTLARGAHNYRVELVGFYKRREKGLLRGQTLVSDIEWEDFEHRWKLDTLEPSESLPPGAQKAEVWRNENYGLRAKFSGTTEGSRIDIYPEGEVGALIPPFQVNGSGERGRVDYEIGPCVLDEVRSSGLKDRDTSAPTVNYEADLYVWGARWTARHGDPAEAEWLSEWYLNGPRLPLMYPQGSGTN